MKKVLLIAIALVFIAGCTRYVKGKSLDLTIKRAPACKGTGKVDGSLILEATAKKPCPKE